MPRKQTGKDSVNNDIPHLKVNNHINAGKGRANIHIPVILFFLIYFIGIGVFHYVEGWDYLTSSYFITATVLTIGYGDVVPKTDLGKIITILYAWLGVGIGFYILVRVSDLRRRYFDDRIARMEEIFVNTVKRSDKKRR